MFKTVGESSEFGEPMSDEDKEGYLPDSFGVAFDGAGIENDPHGSMDSPHLLSDNSEGSDSPRTMKKMFWHAACIDKVQELVPEQVRCVLVY